MGVSRRVALLGLGGVVVLGAAGGGFELVDHAVLPGKGRLDEALGRCDAEAPAHPAVPRAAPPPVLTGTFRSARRNRDVAYALVYPPGHARGERLPVCLALHGFGSNAAQAVSTGGYAALLAGAVGAGAAPFAIAAADGGDGYWHPHAADDPLGMLVEDFLPFLAGEGLDAGRAAVAGWSMGGYGALLCGLTYRDRFRLVVASSPAIFRDYADAERVNAGAFDSAAEWARYDVTGRAAEFAGLRFRVDIGAADPFAPAVRRLRDRLPDPSVVTLSTGCHDGRYWDAVAPGQVAAIAAALG
ncbi:alpha/beta hydrolase-fold protein [Dactylosporangium darangshiense]|uniref:Alpha/beta hydrolase n=1 Tax=Dactylosporangium darangshiense TaxID=579108 RepID=A0ABP8D705_9ACTN